MAVKRPYAVILAGGQGSRFWPLSLPEMPKQFLKLPGVSHGRSLLQDTYERALTVTDREKIVVFGSLAHADLLKKQLPDLDSEQLLLEPFGRNTAACVAAMTNWLLDKDEKVPQLWLPADHVVQDSNAFGEAVDIGLKRLQRAQSLLTFGIQPTRAEVGYGYIEKGEETLGGEVVGVYLAKAFHEKPDAETAQTYLEAKNFFWNSGMFLWETPVIAKAFQMHADDIWQAVLRVGFEKRSFGYTLDSEAFSKVPKLPVDIAIMERAENVEVIVTPMPWSDVGGFASLYDVLEKDAFGNVLVAEKIMAGEAQNNLIIAPDDEVLVCGVSDLVVVKREGRLLVTSMEKVGEIRPLVEKILTREA